MPNRILREGILDSDAVNSLDAPSELFYRRLMSVVDDFGRFDGRPAILRSRLYPLKISDVREADISRWIAACVKAGLIALYDHNSKPYILFGKFGTPRAKESKYPQPPAELERRMAMHADENICAQTNASVPYSYSSSDTYSDTIKPPNPPLGGDSQKPSNPATSKKPFDPTVVPIPKELDTPAFAEVWRTWIADRKRFHDGLTAGIPPEEKLLVALALRFHFFRIADNHNKISAAWEPEPEPDIATIIERNR
jgi:hypothetical protein